MVSLINCPIDEIPLISDVHHVIFQSKLLTIPELDKKSFTLGSPP